MTETNFGHNLTSRLRSPAIRSSNSSSCQTPSFRSKRVKKSPNELPVLTNEKETRNVSPKCTYTDLNGQKRRIVFVLSENQAEPIRPILKFSEIVRSIAERYKTASRAEKKESVSGITNEQSKLASGTEFSPSSLETRNSGLIGQNNGTPTHHFGNVTPV